MKRKTKPEIDYKKVPGAGGQVNDPIHDPEVLIKMIARMIVQRVGVSHADFCFMIMI